MFQSLLWLEWIIMGRCWSPVLLLWWGLVNRDRQMWGGGGRGGGVLQAGGVYIRSPSQPTTASYPPSLPTPSVYPWVECSKYGNTPIPYSHFLLTPTTLPTPTSLLLPIHQVPTPPPFTDPRPPPAAPPGSAVEEEVEAAGSSHPTR